MTKDQIKALIYAIDYMLLSKGAGASHPDQKMLSVVETEHLQAVREKLIQALGEEITLA